MRQISLSVLVLVALVGCAPQSAVEGPATLSSPLPSASAPSPEPTHSDPVALRLSSSAIGAVDGSGAVVEQVEFDRPVAEVVLLIEDVLKESATTVQSDASPCTDSTGITTYTWQDFAVAVYREAIPSSRATWRGPDSYRIAFGAATINGIQLESADGIHVGDDGTEVLTALSSGRMVQVAESAWWALLDVGGSYANDRGTGDWGLAAIVDGGMVTSLSSPTYPLDAFC